MSSALVTVACECLLSKPHVVNATARRLPFAGVRFVETIGAVWVVPNSQLASRGSLISIFVDAWALPANSSGNDLYGQNINSVLRRVLGTVSRHEH